MISAAAWSRSMTWSMERSSLVTLLRAEFSGVFGEQQVGGDAEGVGDREDSVDRDAVLPASTSAEHHLAPHEPQPPVAPTTPGSRPSSTPS